MLDIKLIEQETENVKTNLQKRGFDTSVIDEIVQLNSERKKGLQTVEKSRSEIKQISKQVGQAKKAGEDAQDLMDQVAKLKADMASTESGLDEIQGQIKAKIMGIPNLLDDEVPVGESEDDNVEAFKVGDIPEFAFTPRDHVEIGESLGGLDFEAGANLTGSRFVVYKNDIAKLERALINFMLDAHSDEGYIEAIPPFMVHRKSLEGTGQLPKFEEDLFKISDRDWYLIPTAEVPLTNLKREQLFDASELPLLYAAYTPCFRSEAGSYGKDTKGLIRLHQFNKVEMVNIVAAEDSERAHEAMINRARAILDALKLPYRGLWLCSADIGFGARKCMDLEVWLPGQNKYREISSISNCWDFQARRAGIRYRNSEKKPTFAHTLNGSGLAVGRTVVAILENYQQEDGSVKIPEALVPYMRGKTVITKS